MENTDNAMDKRDFTFTLDDGRVVQMRLKLLGSCDINENLDNAFPEAFLIHEEIVRDDVGTKMVRYYYGLLHLNQEIAFKSV